MCDWALIANLYYLGFFYWGLVLIVLALYKFLWGIIKGLFGF